jgi:putative ATP-dependent endonuclease of the OLD family
MMQKLSWVQIENFRSCKSLSVPLAPLTPVVGRNNAGKSNVLSAIQWFISPYRLEHSDFFDHERPVIVEGEISGISDEVLEELHSEHRQRIQGYVNDERILLRRVCDSPDSKPSQIKLLVFDPDASDDQELWRTNPTGIPDALRELFPKPIRVHAMEDAAEDSSKNKSGTTLKQLLDRILEHVAAKHEEEVNKVLGELDQWFAHDGCNRPEEFQEFDDQCTMLIQEIFPELSLRLRLSSPTFEELFKTATVLAKEVDRDGETRFESLGHGAQRSIQISLVRYLANMNQLPGTSRSLLLVEEPELYLHPQAAESARQALEALSRSGFQVVYSTHSPLMIMPEQVPDTILLHKSSTRGTSVRATIRDAIKDVLESSIAQTRTLFSLTNAAQVLFAERVLLVEGKADIELLPTIYRSALGKSMSSDCIAVVELGGKNNVGNTMAILQHMGIPCASIVDLDFAFDSGVRQRFIDQNDPDLQGLKKVLASLAQSEPIALSTNGLPSRNNDRSKPYIKPEDAYNRMATHQTGVVHVANLHAKLSKQSVWIWRTGSIEHQLGIDKTAEARANFAFTLSSKDLSSTVADPDEFIHLFQWLNGLIAEEVAVD